VTVPSTIQALLAARLESLAVAERELLECGAVEGEVFHRLALRALTGERLGVELESRLAGLVRKELIRPHPETMLRDEAFRFRHLLIRDAAYAGLPKATRAELHERFATWLEANARELTELDEIAGWHLEQAVRYQHELGRTADPALARRAAEHLHAAGRRAGERGDPVAARNLLERAYALTPKDDPVNARIGVDLAEQLIDTGEIERADELLKVAERDPDTVGLASLIRLGWLMAGRPHDVTQTIESALPGIFRQLSEAGDERGLAKAHMAASDAYWIPGRATAAGEQALLAAEHARNAADEGMRLRALERYLATVTNGPTDAQTVAEKLNAIEREQPGPQLAARVVLARGELARLSGDLH
jgi:predicted ATPase